MNYSAFISYMLLMTFTPGSNNIMAMSNAGRYGFAGGMPFNLGVFAGFLVITVSCAASTSVIYRVTPYVEPFMICAGATYILWLAWSVWRYKPHSKAEKTLKTSNFTTGMLLQFINVKVILYNITLMSTFILPHFKGFPELLPFMLLPPFVGFVSTCCWAPFGAVFQRFFQRYDKALNAMLALLLVYCALSQLSALL